MGMKVKDIDALREQISKDPREAFTKHQVWLFASEHNKTVPTVEAIPKDQYEARLKADMVAMLTEIQLEIEELKSYESVDGQDLVMLADIGILFQQKINNLQVNNSKVKEQDNEEL